jgi:hypothetical protein
MNRKESSSFFGFFLVRFEVNPHQTENKKANNAAGYDYEVKSQSLFGSWFPYRLFKRPPLRHKLISGSGTNVFMRFPSSVSTSTDRFAVLWIGTRFVTCRSSTAGSPRYCGCNNHDRGDQSDEVKNHNGAD